MRVKGFIYFLFFIYSFIQLRDISLFLCILACATGGGEDGEGEDGEDGGIGENKASCFYVYWHVQGEDDLDILEEPFLIHGGSS